MQIGAQLYTVHDFCTNLDDFALSLKKVADIGYRTVQVSGVCPYEPQWLKEQLDKNGLKCVITHNPAAKLQEDPVQIARNHDVFGCRYVGLGGHAFGEYTMETVENFARIYGPITQILKENGKTFMYHNHAREFANVEGRVVLDRIAELVPDMGMTLDTYWVQVGGGDPAQWLEKFSGRVPCIHLKDCAYEQKMVPIGEGNINFDRVFQMAEAAGTEYMLVEQDNCNGEDPFDCLARSYKYLKANGFE